jgi:hypothetical protein
MASTTSFVNVLPTPDVPIRTVGLMDWRSGGYDERLVNSFLWKQHKQDSFKWRQQLLMNWSTILNAHERDYLNSIIQGCQGLMLMCPRFFEWLKGVFPRVNNQTLYTKYRVRTSDKQVSKHCTSIRAFSFGYTPLSPPAKPSCGTLQLEPSSINQSDQYMLE